MKKPSQNQIAKLREAIEVFVPIIKRSLQNKANEADTRIIVNDLLERVFGYDKYFEVTAEHMIKSTYVDYAIILDGKSHMLIEVKSMDSQLKQDYIRQTINYAASEGVKWAVLTNGCEWQLYRVIVDKQVDKELFISFSLLDSSSIDYNEVFYLTRESLTKGIIDEYWDYKNALKPSVVLNVLLSQAVIDKIRREVSNISGYKVTSEEIVDILVSKVIRPEVIRESSTAQKKVLKEEKDSSQEIDLKNLTPIQEEILKLLSHSSTHISLEKIKELLTEKGFDFKSLAGTFRGLSLRLGTELVSSDEGYLLSDFAKAMIIEERK
jgi:hypothetical protein